MLSSPSQRFLQGRGLGHPIALFCLATLAGISSGQGLTLGLAPASAQVTPTDYPPSARPGRRPSHPIDLPGTRPAPTGRPASGSESTAPPTPLADPAEAIAPALIDLTAGNQPLNRAQALVMQQELKNLIGRFESAVLLERSLDMPSTLALTVPTGPWIAAGEAKVATSVSDGVLHPALAEAQALLEDWENLWASGQDRELRRRWLKVRDTLWQNLPTARPFAQAEIRAVWLDRGTIVQAQSPEGLAQVFDQLAAAGMTTVFFETVNAGYPIYPSQVAPQQNPLTQHWDPLAAAVSLAHERGMTLHAWVWVFATGNQRHNRLLNLPLDYPGPVLARHPSWAGADNAGRPVPLGQDKPFLDPANPEVRTYLTRLMTEIVRQYDVDGVHLDYIRYPFQDPGANRTYGYGEVARWQFRALTGVDPLHLRPQPDPTGSISQQRQQQTLWNRWTEFRVQQVNSFVETVASTLRRQRPELVLSAAVFAHPEAERIQKIQQDWETWAQAGYLDWIVLMSYAEDTSRFERLVRPWLVDQTFGSALVLPGIRLLPLSNLAAMDQLLSARDLPAAGYALFATADLGHDLATLLQQTQRSPQPTAPPLLAMALDRYQTLQREWNWLLNQQKLWMEEEALTRWIAAANQLETDLKALAASPSRRQLEAVKAGLAQVRGALNQQMVIQTTNNSYRLQVWQYRLRVIDQLVNQGQARSPRTR
ncbi:MAG TPA: family 10 glycosylhydrolase [Leptolyngbyaceae cyanobacterium M65_K2018_010]|nr:family 10 glycosylhydrolase [Leptolyngbyaceae cyanobacterium M65_K2018_010]